MKITEWVDKSGFERLVGIYLVSMVGVFGLGVVAFIFPIRQIYSALGKEFSNLGPIATGMWAIFVDIVVVTPIFCFILIAKLIRRSKSRSDGRV